MAPIGLAVAFTWLVGICMLTGDQTRPAGAALAIGALVVGAYLERR